MTLTLPVTKGKSDIPVVFATSTQRKSLSLEEIIQQIQVLIKKDVAAGEQLLKNAITKGILLRSVKEQTHHGSWEFHLTKIQLQPRQAQRLMSLVPWKDKLMAASRDSLKKNGLPLSVTQAFALVTRWNKEQKKSGEETTSATHQVPYLDTFEFDAKEGVLTITCKINLVDLPAIIKRIKRHGPQFVKEILAVLRANLPGTNAH